MDKSEKTVDDIAYTLKISANTVRRYLRGEPVHRATRARLEELVNKPAPIPGADKAATG